MQDYNVKLKIVPLFIGTLFLAGCANNIDLRKQAKEKKASIASTQDAADFGHPMSKKTLDVLSSKPIRILFVGDMMFDRHIREAVGKYGGGDYGYILEPLKEKISEYDLVVGNLEGPITDNESVSIGSKMGESKNFVFTFDPAVAKVLAENNIKLVNLGNNHILNHGEKGIEQTKKYLDEAGVQYFGDTGESDVIASEAKQSRGNSSSGGIAAVASLPRNDKVVNISGTKIGFVNYNYSVAGSFERAIEDIKLAKKQSDIVVVCPHWGTEYKTGDPGQQIRSEAYQLADAGADAVIGTHPHVVQDSEVYQGKKIYYSLGNFVFDQYFQKETMEGLGVEMTIQPAGAIEYGELEFEMTKKGQTILMQNENIKD